MPGRPLCWTLLSPFVLVLAPLVGCHASSVGDSAGSDAGSDTTSTVDGLVDTHVDPGDTRDEMGSGDVSIGGDIGDPDGRPPADATPIDAGGCGTIFGGPAMVDVGGYCMDVSEVTNKQYNAFLTAKVPPQSVSLTPSYCAFNKSYGFPVNEPESAELPRTTVDWCDAHAFCAWSGKRLCGKIGGGDNDPTDAADATKSEWYAACIGGDASAIYPYGAVFDVTRCNVGSSNPLVAYGTTYDKCHAPKAPWSSIYDLAGSVLEWESSCAGATGGADSCQLRGGAVGFPDAKYSTCNDNYSRNRNNENLDLSVGIRCCKNRI